MTSLRSISASLVSADLGHLAEAVAGLERAGADRLHIDIEDGLFVPNFSLGFPTLQATKRYATLPLEVHLMVQNPEPYFLRVAQMGADLIAVHFESLPYPRRALAAIRALQRKAYLAFNPRTPTADALYLADMLDGLLLLSSEPDGVGDLFIPAAVRKLCEARQAFPKLDIIVDGGITPDLAEHLWRSGASTVVAGRAIFGASDLAGAIRGLRGQEREELS